MTRLSLEPHPDARCEAVQRIEAEAARPRSGSLVLRWCVTGRINDLLLPHVVAPLRAEELWRHTCFESFICASCVGMYYEFNLAPSKLWSAHAFDGYRSGMRVADEIELQHVNVTSDDAHFEIQASLALENVPLRLTRDSEWQLGLSAVIEERNGRLSYWALAHPPGKPDFHHSDCFALELPGA